MLSSLLALAVALVVLPLGLSFAQGTPTIEIVNPNDSSSKVVSDFENTYEATAWLTSVPTGPRVEFVIKDAAGAVVVPAVAGTATVGMPNVYAAAIDIPDSVAEGDYTLEAILYQNYTGPGTGTVADTATQAITINAKNDSTPVTPEDAVAETTVLSYPVNGGELGVNISGNTTSFLLEGRTSSGATSVRGFYSVSPVGTDPAFKSCGGAVTPSGTPKTFTIRCAVAAADFGLDITAVAARADKPGTALPTDDVNGAADGHAVTPYFQRPTTVTVNPETAGSVSPGACALFTAEVLDQEGRPIAGTNVDVHAQGPTDAVAFDVGNTYSDDNQPPDQGHTSTDAAWECPANGTGGAAGDAGTQGTHPVAGQTSRKHIESAVSSTANNTDNSGKFDFALHSDATGTTQLTAWADFDGDDLKCADEAQDSASIGWGVPAPAVVPQPNEKEAGQCAVAEPSPSPSPTASASASASPTSSPTASPTASPTSSPSPEPTEWDRDITLSLKHKGEKLRANGVVTAENGAPDACTSGVPVKIQRRSDGAWKTLKTVTTDGNGNYSAKVKDKKGRYRAVAEMVAADTDTCSQAKATARHSHRR